MAYSLTPREREVLQWVAAGLGGRAIGARLGISERTVRSHVGRLLGKLGAGNRIEMVMIAQRAGLLDGALSTTSLLVAVQRELERAQTHLARARELFRSAQQGEEQPNAPRAPACRATSGAGAREPHGSDDGRFTMRFP